MDLVPAQCGVAVRLDPHSGHGVVEDLVVLDEAQALRSQTGLGYSSFFTRVYGRLRLTEIIQQVPHRSCRPKCLRSDLPRSCSVGFWDYCQFCFKRNRNCEIEICTLDVNHRELHIFLKEIYVPHDWPQSRGPAAGHLTHLICTPEYMWL